jgi:hypothetical protein
MTAAFAASPFPVSLCQEQTMVDMNDRMIANVNVEEQTENILTTAQQFYRNNRDAILIIGVMALTLWINKRSLRRELKRLNFTVEVYPDYFDNVDGLDGMIE